LASRILDESLRVPLNQLGIGNFSLIDKIEGTENDWTSVVRDKVVEDLRKKVERVR